MQVVEGGPTSAHGLWPLRPFLALHHGAHAGARGSFRGWGTHLGRAVLQRWCNQLKNGWHEVEICWTSLNIYILYVGFPLHCHPVGWQLVSSMEKQLHFTASNSNSNLLCRNPEHRIHSFLEIPSKENIIEDYWWPKIWRSHTCVEKWMKMEPWNTLELRSNGPTVGPRCNKLLHEAPMAPSEIQHSWDASSAAWAWLFWKTLKLASYHFLFIFELKTEDISRPSFFFRPHIKLKLLSIMLNILAVHTNHSDLILWITRIFPQRFFLSPSQDRFPTSSVQATGIEGRC